jgi:hypothetical protein
MSPEPNRSSDDARRPRLLREPLLHFLALGGLLFGLYAVVARAGGGDDAAGGEARREIAVTVPDLDRLERTFADGAGRPPSAAERAELVRAHVRDEALYREALALGLDREDPVVRRRLVDKMAFLSRQLAPPPEPTEKDLEARFAAHRQRYGRPTRLTISQLFFDERRLGQAVAVKAARAALAALASARGPEADLAALGHSFVLPERLEDKTEAEIAHLLGADFARTVMGLAPGAWMGPVRSQFGLHVVRVVKREEGREPALAEARERVRADVMAERLAGSDDREERRLAGKYRVTIEPEAARRLGQAAAAIERPAAAPEPGR